MSKLVFPLTATPRRRWLFDFTGGLIRGAFTVGASGVLTVVTILWLRGNGYLTG